jgi:hypothetical protein
VTLIVRIVVVVFAFMLASAAAAAVLTFGLRTENEGWFDVAADQAALGIAIVVSTLVIAGYGLLPGMIVLAIAEGFRLRSIVFYAAAGAAAAMLIAPGSSAPIHARDLLGREQELIAASGIVAGLIYWALAGRTAGAWRDRRTVLRNSPRSGSRLERS